VFLPKPVAALSDKRVVACSCGDTHTLCVTSDGLLYSFGRNSNGQLGNGRTDDNTTPAVVEALQGQKVIAVSCGAEHSVVATETGQVYAWGWGRYGNVGDGQKVDRLTPTLSAIPENRRIVAVASGWRHSLALDAEGRVYSWGWGSYGQLGHGQRQDEATPREVTALAGRCIRRIAGGWRHTLATDDQGNLWAWGWNKFGQLGLGRARPDASVPERVQLLDDARVIDVAAGWRHSICVTEDGGFYTWARLLGAAGRRQRLRLGLTPAGADPQPRRNRRSGAVRGLRSCSRLRGASRPVRCGARPPLGGCRGQRRGAAVPGGRQVPEELSTELQPRAQRQRRHRQCPPCHCRLDLQAGRQPPAVVGPYDTNPQPCSGSVSGQNSGSGQWQQQKPFTAGAAPPS
jgi:hypothetical protein